MDLLILLLGVLIGLAIILIAIVGFLLIGIYQENRQLGIICIVLSIAVIILSLYALYLVFPSNIV